MKQREVLKYAVSEQNILTVDKIDQVQVREKKWTRSVENFLHMMYRNKIFSSQKQ